jgi:hypothetical protein
LPAAASFERLFLPERAQHQRVYPAFEVAGDVFERLAHAFGELRGEMERMRAELAHGDLERGARAQRRLLEEQGDVLAGERGRRRRIGAEPAVRLHLAASASSRSSPA